MHDAAELDRRVRDALPEWRLIVVGLALVQEIALLRRAVERLAETREPNAADRARTKLRPRKLEA